MSNTGSPRWAKDTARLQAVEVFPSPTWALVTNKLCGGRGAVDSKTEVRRLRKDSANGEDGRLRTSSPTGFAATLVIEPDRGNDFRLYPSVPAGMTAKAGA